MWTNCSFVYIDLSLLEYPCIQATCRMQSGLFFINYKHTRRLWENTCGTWCLHLGSEHHEPGVQMGTLLFFFHKVMAGHAPSVRWQSLDIHQSLLNIYIYWWWGLSPYTWESVGVFWRQVANTLRLELIPDGSPPSQKAWIFPQQPRSRGNRPSAQCGTSVLPPSPQSPWICMLPPFYRTNSVWAKESLTLF